MGETIIPHDQRVQEVLRSAYHWLDRHRPKLNGMSTVGRAEDGAHVCIRWLIQPVATQQRSAAGDTVRGKAFLMERPRGGIGNIGLAQAFLPRIAADESRGEAASKRGWPGYLTANSKAPAVR